MVLVVQELTVCSLQLPDAALITKSQYQLNVLLLQLLKVASEKLSP